MVGHHIGPPLRRYDGRIEPERGHVSVAMLDHYRRMVECCRRHGLTPMVTLNHAVAAAMVHGPATGLALLDPLAVDPAMRRHQPIGRSIRAFQK